MLFTINADNSCKYMKQFESYDFKDQRMTKSTRNRKKVFHKDKMEQWKCPENVFGQLERALDDRCSYFKTMDIVQYELFHCK